MLFRTIILIVLMGVLITWGFMVQAGEPENWWWWPLFLPFAAWAAVPYAAAAFASYHFRKVVPALWLLLLAGALLSLSATYLLYEAFVAHPDAQSGIVFIFLPVCQLLGLAPFVIAANFLHNRQARHLAGQESTNP